MDLSQTIKSIVEEEYFVRKGPYAVAMNVAILVLRTARGSDVFLLVQSSAAVLIVCQDKNAVVPEFVCHKAGDNFDRQC